jgi:hypothetical protein
VSKPPASQHRRRRVVFDRDGLDATVPAPEQGGGPDPDRLRQIVEEFFRIDAIAPPMLNQRRDYLLVVAGVQDMQRMLYEVFAECNKPLPPMGVKHWSARLTPGQRQILTALPVAKPEPDSIVTATRAVAEAMRTAGRAAVRAHGCQWPALLDEGVQRFMDRSFPES